jgi:hypothetical protein
LRNCATPLSELFVPYTEHEQEMMAHQVSMVVTNPKSNDPRRIELVK